MTPEELEQALTSGDAERVVSLLEGATEAERRAAAPLARDLNTRIRGHWQASYTGRGETLDADLAQRLHGTAVLGVLGTGSKSDILRLVLPDYDLAFRLLAARRTEWMESWAEEQLRKQRWCWPLIRRFEKAGLIGRPQCDEYTLGMIAAGYRDGAYELLKRDPELLETEVWRLFEVEGDRDGSLASNDKYAGKKSWTDSLVELAAEGYPCRDRLLDASLDALSRDFEQFRAGWFSRFHEALAPMPEEREARADRYLALLSSRIPPTVSFALKAVAALQKAGKLSGEALLAHVAPALAAREKGTVTTCLKLLARVTKAHPELGQRAAWEACEALLHEAPEVQGAALALIEKYGHPSEPGLRSRLEERLTDLAASQRPRLESLLGSPPIPGEEDEAAGEAELSDLIARAGRIPRHFRELAGIDAALQDAVAGTLTAQPLPLPFHEVPRLDPAAALQPIEDLDELIHVFSQVLEASGPPEELERVLDGVSRLCAERPPDFDRRVAPLRKRSRKLFEEAEWVHTFWGWLPQDLAALALAWTSGFLTKIDKSEDVDLTFFHGLRVYEVSRRAVKEQAWPLLALPTHRGGWIDPRVLVKRVRAASDWGPADAVQALLRLAPDRRREALETAQDLDGVLGAVTRYALGDRNVSVEDAPPGRGAAERAHRAALWAAAARARHPLGDDPAVAQRYPDLGPDAGTAARRTFRVEHSTHTYDGTTYHHYTPHIDVEPAAPKEVGPEFPTVLLNEAADEEAPVRRWSATIWPAGRPAWFARGVERVGGNIDWWEAEWRNRAYLEALLEPDTPLCEMGRLLLAIGLGAKETSEAALSVDALIAAAEDGRVTGPLLGEAMAQLVTTGLIKPARWARTLGEAARTSPLHRETIRTALERILAVQPEMRPTDLGVILQLVQELCIESGAAVLDPNAREYLARIKTGKSGALARALLGLEARDRACSLRTAARAALAGRVARAERWVARVSPG